MSITDTRTIWVIDAQSIFCQNGMPFAIPLNKLTNLQNFNLDDAIHLTDGNFALDKQNIPNPDINLPQGEFIAYRHLVGRLNNTLAGLFSQAIQLIYFHKTHQFCGVCGHKTIKNTLENNHIYTHRICTHCQHHIYPKIQPCVIVAITRLHPTTQKPQILLAKHHRHTDIYTLIAGFVEVGETLEMATVREVYEEVGLQIDAPVYFNSQAWPYPTNLMVGFIAKYRSGKIILQQDELNDARFFDLDKLPNLPPCGTLARKIIDAVCH